MRNWLASLFVKPTTAETATTTGEKGPTTDAPPSVIEKKVTSAPKKTSATSIESQETVKINTPNASSAQGNQAAPAALSMITTTLSGWFGRLYSTAIPTEVVKASEPDAEGGKTAGNKSNLETPTVERKRGAEKDASSAEGPETKKAKPEKSPEEKEAEAMKSLIKREVMDKMVQLDYNNITPQEVQNQERVLKDKVTPDFQNKLKTKDPDFMLRLKTKIEELAELEQRQSRAGVFDRGEKTFGQKVLEAKRAKPQKQIEPTELQQKRLEAQAKTVARGGGENPKKVLGEERAPTPQKYAELRMNRKQDTESVITMDEQELHQYKISNKARLRRAITEKSEESARYHTDSQQQKQQRATSRLKSENLSKKASTSAEALLEKRGQNRKESPPSIGLDDAGKRYMLDDGPLKTIIEKSKANDLERKKTSGAIVNHPGGHGYRRSTSVLMDKLVANSKPPGRGH